MALSFFFFKSRSKQQYIFKFLYAEYFVRETEQEKRREITPPNETLHIVLSLKYSASDEETMWWFTNFCWIDDKDAQLLLL